MKKICRPLRWISMILQEDAQRESSIMMHTNLTDNRCLYRPRENN